MLGMTRCSIVGRGESYAEMQGYSGIQYSCYARNGYSSPITGQASSPAKRKWYVNGAHPR